MSRSISLRYPGSQTHNSCCPSSGKDRLPLVMATLHDPYDLTQPGAFHRDPEALRHGSRSAPMSPSSAPPASSAPIKTSCCHPFRHGHKTKALSGNPARKRSREGRTTASAFAVLSTLTETDSCLSLCDQWRPAPHAARPAEPWESSSRTIASSFELSWAHRRDPRRQRHPSSSFSVSNSSCIRFNRSSTVKTKALLLPGVLLPRRA